MYKVYTFAYANTYTCAKHIVLHMQNYMFCITYEKLFIFNKKRRAFHEEAPTTKITTDRPTAFVFCVLFLKCNILRRDSPTLYRVLDDVYANDTPLTYKICIQHRKDGYVRVNNH